MQTKSKVFYIGIHINGFFTEDVVQFGDSEVSPTKIEEGETNFEGGENVDTRNGEVGEDDVNTRFFNVDLGTFGNDVCSPISN